MPTQQETGEAQGEMEKAKRLPLQEESIYLECGASSANVCLFGIRATRELKISRKVSWNFKGTVDALNHKMLRPYKILKYSLNQKIVFPMEF